MYSLAQRGTRRATSLVAPAVAATEPHDNREALIAQTPPCGAVGQRSEHHSTAPGSRGTAPNRRRPAGGDAGAHIRADWWCRQGSGWGRGPDRTQEGAGMRQHQITAEASTAIAHAPE